MNETRVALVTGSTHGIGKVIALELAKSGYKIIINGASTLQLSQEYKEQLKYIYGGQVEKMYMYIQADVSKYNERQLILNKIRENFNRIDVLVNNAGVAPLERKDILEAKEDSFERVMKINLQGPYFLTQGVANWMIELRKALGKEYHPYIINISSISSFTASPSRGEYCVSKAGMSMMTKLYAIRLAEENIPVYEIQPGIILTPMTESVKEKYDRLIQDGITPIPRWGYPEDIAKTVISIVSGGLPYSTGDVIKVDGGFHLHEL